MPKQSPQSSTDTDIELRNEPGWSHLLANVQDCPPQQLPLILSRVLNLATQVRSFKSDIEASIIERLEQLPGRQLIHGEMRFSIGTKTQITCCDKASVCDDVLRHLGGDLSALAGTLVKEPFKSSARRISPDNFQIHHRSTLEIKSIPLNFKFPTPTKGNTDERKEKD